MNDSSLPNTARAPLWLNAVGGLALLGLAVAFAYYTVFSRPMSLDEGYLMITVRGFLEGHALYDDLFTQYGPFFYLYEWLLRGWLQVPLTHDATRWLCLVHWLTAAVLCGFAGRQLTRSVPGGAFVFMQSLVHLRFLADEPGHPQELVALLLALSAVVATREKLTRSSGWTLALVCAALALTKINVGVFFGLALLLTLRVHATDRWAPKLNWLLPLCAVVPFLLVRRHLGLDWCRMFAVIVSCTLAATCFAAMRFSARNDLNAFNYWRMAAAFAAAVTSLLVFSLVRGASLHGLAEGILLIPLKMPAIAILALNIPRVFCFSALAAVVVAVLVFGGKMNARALALLKLSYGLMGTLLFVGEPSAQVAALLPWCWLVLVPSSPGQTSPDRQTFGRVFLCFMTAFQTLQAYPMAGTQVAVGTFLLVLVYALCVADCLRTVDVPAPLKARFFPAGGGAFPFARTAGAAALLAVFALVWCGLPAARRAYASLAPLDLPGSKLMRMEPQARTEFQSLARYLEAESDTFITYPCVNSLYFWAHKPPPTQLNGVGWLQFTPAQQERILAALSQAAHPKIVIPVDMARSWASQPPEIKALARYVSNQCVEERRIGRYAIFVPKPRAEHAATQTSTP